MMYAFHAGRTLHTSVCQTVSQSVLQKGPWVNPGCCSNELLDHALHTSAHVSTGLPPMLAS
jgi:hypothetical protein